VRAGVVLAAANFAAMPMPSLRIIGTRAIFALTHRSARRRAARILRVLGLVARAAELDARRIVRSVARLGDRDAAKSAESENPYDQDLHQC
jgi:hypothetical protein